MRFGGANQDLLWLGFARRGFGDRATTTGPDDGDPRADFTSPLHGRAAVDFDVVSAETGQSVPAKVYVGHYEARATPVADTDPQSLLRYEVFFGPFHNDGDGAIGSTNTIAYCREATGPTDLVVRAVDTSGNVSAPSNTIFAFDC